MPVATRKRRREATEASEGGGTRAGAPLAAGGDSLSAQDVAGPMLSPQELGIQPSMGPFVRVKLDTSDKFWGELMLALESGVASQVSWALNIMQVLSYTEKDRWQRFLSAVGHMPAVISALIDLTSGSRTGASSAHLTAALSQLSPQSSRTTHEDQARKPKHEVQEPTTSGTGAPQQNGHAAVPAEAAPSGGTSGERPLPPGLSGGSIPLSGGDPELWWLDKGLLHPGEKREREMAQCAMAAMNVLRNLSFFPDHAPAMAASKPLVLCMLDVVLDWETEDPELVTSALDTLQNLSLGLRLSSLCSLSDGHTTHIPEPPAAARLAGLAPSGAPSQSRVGSRGGTRALNAVGATGEECGVRRLLSALQAMLGHPARAWHAGAAEVLGRLLANGQRGNGAFLLPFSATGQVFPRLSAMLADKDLEVKASAVTAVASFAEASMRSRLRIAETTRLVDRLIQCTVSLPPPYLDVSKRAAGALEALAQEPRLRGKMLSFEERIFGVACLDTCKVADVFARILMRLSTDSPSSPIVHEAHTNVWSTVAEE